MNITGTHINYYLVCQRKLWLFHHQVQMEQNSDLVKMGKLIHETAYPNRNVHYEEISIDGIKIDYYDPRHNVVHEIKKTGSYEEAHEWQLKYYLYVLQQNGFDNVTGVLEYPAQRTTKNVTLIDEDTKHLMKMKIDIQNLIEQPTCPGLTKTKGCRNCAYHDFCFIGEEQEEI